MSAGGGARLGTVPALGARVDVLTTGIMSSEDVASKLLVLSRCSRTLWFRKLRQSAGMVRNHKIDNSKSRVEDSKHLISDVRVLCVLCLSEVNGG